jgi:hypothetical protein
VGTLDFLYTLGVNSVHTVNVNLSGPVGVAAGEGGRVLYGAIDSTGVAAPGRRSAALRRGVFEIRNGSGDRSYSITGQLSKRFSNGTEVSAAYTYTDANDRLSMGLDIAGLNARTTPLEGSLEHRAVRTSFWERPHKVTLVATTNLPLGFRLGLTYLGTSGAAYTYVARGDPNADGFQPEDFSNDIVYLPKDAADIALADSSDWVKLDRLIRSQPCLRNQRGHIMQRNSCRDPWASETAASLSKRFGLPSGRELEVTADLFNVLGFLGSDWSRVHSTASDAGSVQLLDLVGYDLAGARGVYQLLEVAPRELDVGSTQWRMELGAAVSF